MSKIGMMSALLLLQCGYMRGSEINTNKIRVVCLGDSLTTCGGKGGRYTDWLATWLPACEVINKGIGGDTLAGGIKRFERDVLNLQPDVLVLELGANDFWEKRPIKDMQTDLEHMVAEARKRGIEVVIASCFGNRNFDSETPVEFHANRFDYSSAIGRMESRIAAEHNCLYVPNMQMDIKPNGRMPFWNDKNHPSRQGNELVARRVLVKLRKALDRVAKAAAP